MLQADAIWRAACKVSLRAARLKLLHSETQCPGSDSFRLKLFDEQRIAVAELGTKRQQALLAEHRAERRAASSAATKSACCGPALAFPAKNKLTLELLHLTMGEQQRTAVAAPQKELHWARQGRGEPRLARLSPGLTELWPARRISNKNDLIAFTPAKRAWRPALLQRALAAASCSARWLQRALAAARNSTHWPVLRGSASARSRAAHHA